MTERGFEEAIHTIATHYGVEKQSMQTCEECGELITAVSKLTRGETSARILSLIEEIADVRIMMSQLMLLYGISDLEVTEVMQAKLERQLERIKRKPENDQ